MMPDDPIPEAIRPNEPLNINCRAEDGKVIVEFSRPIQVIILGPVEGVVLANTILTKVITAANPANRSRIIKPV